MDSQASVDPESRIATIGRNAAQLQEHEIAWRDKQGYLEEHGYMLRPRFHPEWVPSWISNGQDPMVQEDFESLPLRPNLIDATRVSDGKTVYIKRVRTGNEEQRIAGYFSEIPRRDDSRNHCVPILDSFQDDENPAISYIVMPFLRPMDDPEFYFVDDVVDCVNQLLEGLVFIHEHHVAHRDCAPENILMDSSTMYPRGYHPQLMDLLPDAFETAPFVTRLATRPPVKYYYIDFGMSTKFDPEESPKLVLGCLGRDREAPELSDSVPYDPFKVDVFIVGNVLRKLFYDPYSNLTFLMPLIELMTQNNSRSRLSSKQAWEEWQKIRKSVWLTQRARRLRSREESRTQAFFKDIRAFFKLGSALSRRWLYPKRR